MEVVGDVEPIETREVGVAPRFEASRHGAAYLALRGSGLIGERDDMPGPPRVRLVRADPTRVTRYRAARERQGALYEAILG